ncbi:hypothetical protein HZH66_007624 [Vespula vulgaris]|uniref:Uncharacterized protein n=1 Tax=Vespula vulgaris TaxID=7454 RepID=A0A834JZZ2_VESVU|nr:hypothetical protein HZH66_007624 [Vespula vulgaris]
MDPSRCNSLEFTRISDRYRSAGRVEIIGFNCRLCNLISLALMGFFVPLTHDKLRSAVGRPSQSIRIPTTDRNRTVRPSTDRDSGSSDGNGVVLLSGFALSTPSRRFARLPLPLHANN